MKGLVLAVIGVVLCGCMSSPQNRVLPNDPFYAPVLPDMPRQKIAQDGSLFQPDRANDLFSDIKARNVGDIISVNLRENTTANKAANTITRRDSEVSMGPLTGLGGNPLLGGNSLELDVESESQFQGDAQSNQSNNLLGNISVTVIQVLPNNNLVVRGEKWMTLNNGDEYIRLTGIIRPEDISPTNEILSTKIANARIQYSGTGTFSSAQQQGWLTRFFSSEWWPL